MSRIIALVWSAFFTLLSARRMLFLCFAFIAYIKIMLKYKANPLYCIRLAQRVFIHRMGICLCSEFSIWSKQVLYIQISKEWAIAQVVVAITKIAIDATPVFLPGNSHGQRSLAGYSPWGHEESDMTEAT